MAESILLWVVMGGFVTYIMVAVFAFVVYWYKRYKK